MNAIADGIHVARNSLMVQRAYDKINDKLKEADLTINLDPEKWFTTENKYESYTQMYERATDSTGRTFLKSDPLNPADTRARVDDAVTFPAHWKGASTAPMQRGLMPGRQSEQRIMNQMEFGGQQKAFKLPKNGKPEEGLFSKNPHFNAKTKQIFAALNYGRRPHGSTIQYGNGYLKLSPKLKVNALYYPADTFLITDASAQVPYLDLALILGMGNDSINAAIIDSCYYNRALADTANMLDLLEGHIFGALPFKNNVVEVCLPAQYAGTTIGGNAEKFAEKHGARLEWTS